MVDVRAIGARYSQLLCAYVADQGEHSLAELAELGREALKIGLPPEEIGDIHQTALLGLAREHPEMAIRDAAEFTSAPLVELLMAYGLAFREQAAKRESLMKDLTAREQLYRQMFMSNQALQLLINPDSWSIVDVNPAACAFYGYAVEELKNMKLSNIFADEPDRLQEILLSADDGGPTHFGRRQRLRSGAIRNVEIFPSNVTVRDRQLLYWIVHDITERKKAEDTIRSMAQTDFLTGLSNRSQFHQRLKEAVKMAQRLDRLVALLFIDLDGFKDVNDNFGHPVGDALLKKIANILKELVRETDIVARLGGDEFAVILSNLENSTGIDKFALRIIEQLSQPLNVDGSLVKVGASIGISFYPLDGAEPDELLRKGDLSLYQAKSNGRGTYCLYDEDMHSAMRARSALETDMKLALIRNEFVLHYQPQVSLPEGRIIGAEALIRWTHPALGLISPGEFIAVAESSDLIVEIGAWVLHESCRQIKAWRDAGLPPFRVAVNASARQFQSANLMPTVISALDDAGLDSKWLELEVTEGVMLDDVDQIIELLRAFNELGVQLTVDDFGTGYSSLSYLKRFPIQRLKIDQSFVANIASDPDDAAITEAIIHMGKSLHLNVIAEGVETEEQAAYLSGKGCAEAQGYLFSRPLAAEEFTVWATESQRREAV